MARDGQQASGLPDGTAGIGNLKSAVAVANLRCAAALIGTLAQLGVRHFVVSSGSRSTPLVLAVAHRADIDITIHPDERAAGFRALGIGKALHRPAALICTSGTAAANYYPAIIEARLSHTPLIVLTADRPPGLRGKGAPQTIDQVGLYAHYPRYQADLPEPRPGKNVENIWADNAARAYASANGIPPGPVHLNTPFAEPLIPEPEVTAQILQDIAALELPQPSLDPLRISEASPPEEWDLVRTLILQSSRPLLIIGPQTDCELPAAGAGWLGRIPVLADPASQWRTSGRCDDNIIAHYDLSLRSAGFAKQAIPDCVVRLGGLPTSKTLNQWLADPGMRTQVLVSAHDEPADPYGFATHRLRGQAADSISRLFSASDAARCDPSYLHLWQHADETAAAVIAADCREHDDREPFEADIVTAAFRHAPEGGTIYLSNSMPIRWADAYVPARSPAVRVLVNRGANGIDGVISSAAGAASVSQRPVVLVIGDIAVLHDLNGLWGVARDRLALKIILLDNNGGGIFSFLPIADHTTILERYVAMPHGLDLAQAASLFDIPWHRAASLPEFVDAYIGTLSIPGPQIIAVNTDRERALKRHRERCRPIASRLA